MVSSSAFGTFTSPGVNATIHNTFTPSLQFTYFVTDHVAVEVFTSVPPKLEVSSTGSVTPVGAGGPSLSLANLHPVLSVRAWAPIVLAKYYFGGAESRVRPFVGVGMNYTWFRSVQLNPGFSGPLGQAAGPGGSIQTSISPSWNPVLTGGASYQFNKHWSLMGSVTWFPLKTNASFNAVSANGHIVLSNKTRMSAEPLFLNIGVGYKF
nr:OmpW family outer membrane protein [Burkholderia ambifaria]